MKRNKSSISKAASYEEMGEFWDRHDLADYWEQGHEAQFEVDIQSETVLYAVEKELSNELRHIAEKRGVSPDTLLNLWVQEKIMQLTNKHEHDFVTLESATSL